MTDLFTAHCQQLFQLCMRALQHLDRHTLPSARLCPVPTLALRLCPNSCAQQLAAAAGETSMACSTLLRLQQLPLLPPLPPASPLLLLLLLPHLNGGSCAHAKAACSGSR
jgi:hypothetical protein